MEIKEAIKILDDVIPPPDHATVDLDHLPIAQAWVVIKNELKRKRGKWVDVMTEEWCTFDECKCSVCGVVEYFNKGWKKFSYCPNCGAQMERSEE